MNLMIEILKPYKRVFRNVAIFTGVLNLLMLVPAIFMLQVFDRVMSSRNEFTLLLLVLIMLFFYVIHSALEGVRGLAVIRVSEELDESLNNKVYESSFRRMLAQKGNQTSQLLNDVTVVRQFLTGQSIFILFDMPWFPVYLVMLFAFNVWLGVYAVFSIVIISILTILNEVFTKKALQKANTQSSVSISDASNTIQNAEVIQALGMMSTMKGRWQKSRREGIDLQSLASERAAKLGTIVRFFRLTTQSLIMAVSCLLALENLVTAGMMIASNILLGRVLQPMEMFVSQWGTMQTTLSSYQRIKDVLQEEKSYTEKMSLPPPTGKISLKGLVVCSPQSDKPIIDGVSMELDAGDVLGVIGPSGSGKSTLVRALLGIWPVSEGEVRLDGSEISNWNRDELGGYLGYLPQDVEIFQGSIAENISRFGNVVPENVIEAAQKADIHGMVLNMPDGYNTLVGPGGLGLSGGQRQRLGIARAIYGAPKIVVLDEPNSNLDQIGEMALTKTIMSLRAAGSTVVVVTHRTNILQATTKLLVMANGKMQLFGDRDQVLKMLQEKNLAVAVPGSPGNRA
jgi:ATP-binding cassette, subfamily C, bacterial exporter for protease/lipase